MSCVLRIEGEIFNVDQFLESTGLIPYEKHIKGEKLKFRNPNATQYSNSGCKFDLSFADFDQFDLQKKDVLKFLKRNYDKLITVYQFGLTKDEPPQIDFAIESAIHELFVQSKYIEPELLKLAGDLQFGIVISLYHPSEG